MGISISIPGGGSGVDANDFTVRLVAEILNRQGSVALGHIWPKGKVMDHLAHWISRRIQDRNPKLTVETPAAILNLIAWPDEAPAEEIEPAVRSGLLMVEEPVRPQELASSDSSVPSSFLRARALTELRRQLTSRCNVRFCLGGKTAGYSGRLPGVTEEAYLALKSGQPLYLAGGFGGASGTLVNAIIDRKVDADTYQAFLTPDPVAEEYARHFDPSLGADLGASTAQGWLLLNEFAQVSLGSLADGAGLSTLEYQELATSQNPDRIMELVVVGLENLAASGRQLPLPENS